MTDPVVSARECRRIVAARSGGLCEIAVPGVCLHAATNMSHRRARSQGGKWIPSNILHACGSGTTGCHGYIEAHPNTAHDNGWRLWAGEDATCIPTRMGDWWVLLDDNGFNRLAGERSA